MHTDSGVSASYDMDEPPDWPHINDEPVDLTTREKLERKMQGFITAINKRNFDVNSAAWSHTSPEFTGEVERPPGDSDLTPPGMMPLKDHLAMFQFMAEMYPDFFIKIFDLNTEIDEKAGMATMFWNGETHGVPTGVVLPSVGICDFKRYGQSWMCISFKGARGMGDGIPDAPVM